MPRKIAVNVGAGKAGEEGGGRLGNGAGGQGASSKQQLTGEATPSKMGAGAVLFSGGKGGDLVHHPFSSRYLVMLRR